MTPPLLFGLMFVVSMGNGHTMPNANAGIVLAMPKAAGAASGIGTSVQMAAGALASIIVGALFARSYGPAALIGVMAVFAAFGVIAGTFIRPPRP
jgi:DHA1 family bicyclomycin/chloramphenicol resistance-like MFS transporter